MRILVTGGLGFIGYNVVSSLERLGQEIIVTDNRTLYPPTTQIELDTLIKLRENTLLGTAIVYNVSINNAKAIFEIHSPDIVVNLASPPRQQAVSADPATSSQTMSEGLITLLELCSTHKIKKFVHISSSMVYGNFVNDVVETAVCNPIGQYGILKLASEMLVRDYSRRCGFAHTIIRPSAVYGPLDVTDRVVAKFFYTAMQGGVMKVNGSNETLDFTYIDDLVSGIVAATRSPNANNKIYNLTRGRSRTLLTAAKLVQTLVGKGVIETNEKDPNFPSRGSLNIDAARKDFGFNPQIDIEQGFKQYYDWIKPE
jgi:nucleoside-diphosphate-sugar epimerase